MHRQTNRQSERKEYFFLLTWGHIGESIQLYVYIPNPVRSPFNLPVSLDIQILKSILVQLHIKEKN